MVNREYLIKSRIKIIKIFGGKSMILNVQLHVPIQTWIRDDGSVIPTS